MERLFQGLSKGEQNGQKIKSTVIFFFIDHNNVSMPRVKELICTRIVGTVRKMKLDKNRTRIILEGNNIRHSGVICVLTAHLEIAKLLFNSVLSRKGAQFMTLDIENLFIINPMTDYK